MSRKRKQQQQQQPNGTAPDASDHQASKKQKLQAARSKDASKASTGYSSPALDFAVLFEGLSSDNDAHRSQAVHAFVAKCKAVLDSGAADPLAHFLDFTQPRNVYVRLIKGTCTSAKKSRVGFSAALQLLLAQGVYSRQLPGRLLELVEENTQPGQDALKSEKRECLVGRMTSYRAVLLAECFSRSSATHLTVNFGKLTDAMCELVDKAPHVLREPCGEALCQAVDKLAEQDALDDDIRDSIIASTMKSSFVRSLEGAAVWLEIVHVSPTSVKLPKGPLGAGPLRVFSQEVLHLLKKGSDATEEDGQGSEKDTSGRRQATPSFAWEVLLAQFAKGSTTTREVQSSKTDTKSIESTPEERFWQEAVHDNFFADKASDNKKSLGFQVFAMALRHNEWPVKDAWFSPRLLQCLQNQCRSSSNKVFGPAKAAVVALNARVAKDAASAALILKHLTMKTDEFIDFDSLTSATGVKVVQNLLKSTPDESLGDALHGVTGAAAYNAQKSGKLQQLEGAAGLILQAIRLRRQQLSTFEVTSKTWPWQTLHTLLQWSCGTMDGQPLASDLVKGRFVSCLAELLAACPGAAKLPYQLARALKKTSIPALETAAEPETAKKHASRALKTLDKLKDASSPLPQSYRLLLSMTLLETYTGDTQSLAILRDLTKAYSDELASATKSVDAIVEILVSFASRPSLARRKLSDLVFPAFASAMSFEALCAITEVLEQSESVAGQKALFDEGGDDDDDAGSDVDSDVDSDLEEVGEDDAGSEEESDSADDDDDDEEVGDDSADERLNSALGTLLRTRPSKLQSTNHDSDDDSDTSDSSSDSSMSDAAMLALEPQLSAAFAQHSQRSGKPSAAKKKAATAAKQTMQAFKNRLLDLLALWLKRDPSSPLAPHAITPLLRALRATKTPQLANKIAALLAAFFDAAKKSADQIRPRQVDADDEDALLAEISASPGLGLVRDLRGAQRTLFALLAGVHEEVRAPRASKRHAGVCSRASVVVARWLVLSGSVDREDGDEDEDEGRRAMRAAVAYLYTRSQLLGAPVAFGRDGAEWVATVSAGSATS